MISSLLKSVELATPLRAASPWARNILARLCMLHCHLFPKEHSKNIQRTFNFVTGDWDLVPDSCKCQDQPISMQRVIYYQAYMLWLYLLVEVLLCSGH
jgi:hypothetical protein